jgi:DNA mismatch endonuclease (patch repair protein)
MSRIGPKNTKPEMRVRKAAHSLGYRFRLHRRDLPGTPDVVFPRYRVAMFVHGCFWHRHPGCGKAYTPKSRLDFWSAKFDANVERDARQHDALAAAGWRPVVVWECETDDPDRLVAIIRSRVGTLDGPPEITDRDHSGSRAAGAMPEVWGPAPNRRTL